MTVIKLCGLRRPEEIRLVNELKPDYVGFMLYERSKRYCAPERLTELVALLDPAITSVAVTVNAEPEFLVSLVAQGAVRALQLHGHEDETYLRALRSLLETRLGHTVPLIQAVALKTAADLERARVSSADILLLDAQGGGSGTCFDWGLLTPQVRATLRARPWFLAGGLRPENVAAALAAVQPWGVDVSSGLETPEGCGVKDLAKLRAFCAAVRAVDAPQSN